MSDPEKKHSVFDFRGTVMDEIDSAPVLTTDYGEFSRRLQTFESYPKQMKPDKYELARAGFSYTGKSDIVQCFHCGLKLKDWERNDNAMLEHERWSTRCEFLHKVGYRWGGVDCI